jgi:hypothetical protein
MGRRGILSLATPGALSARLQRDMSSQSPQPGMLIIELRGEGAGRTERDLEVYITTVASQANAMRERRADGIPTVIAQAARAGEPVSDARLAYAGGIFTFGFGAAMALGIVLWRRMREAKESFDKELFAEVKAEEAAWSQEPRIRERPRM